MQSVIYYRMNNGVGRRGEGYSTRAHCGQYKFWNPNCAFDQQQTINKPQNLEALCVENSSNIISFLTKINLSHKV